MTHEVRVSMFPDQVLEVGDAEYVDLQRQGLLVEDEKANKPRRAAVQPAEQEN